jgi:hypothetical protein
MEAYYSKQSESIYLEPEKVLFIYFVQKGSLNFVLPRYADTVFHKVQVGDIIGLEDYIY